MASDYTARVSFIQTTTAALTHRGRLAVALAAANRCFELAADGLAAPPLEMAVELTRLSLLGETVSVDEASWAWRAIEDAEIDAALDLLEAHRAAGHVLLYLAEAQRAPDSSHESAASALEALMEAAHYATEDDGASEEFAWIERVLTVARAGTLEADDISKLGAEAPPRWMLRALAYVQPDEEDPEDLQEQAAALIARRPAEAAARAARVAELRRTRPAVPRFRARDGIPAALAIRDVGKGADSSEGKIAVSGRKHHGVFRADAEAGAAPLFVPPESAGIGMTADEKTLVSWRVARLPGVSGVARGHHRWTLELYAWPGGAPVASHVVQSQAMIDWYSPGWLEVPTADDGALVVLFRAFNEDGRCDLTITRGADGTFSEAMDERSED